MKLLLDTNVFLWCLSDVGKLSAAAQNAIMAKNSTVCVSQVSLLEIQIKIGIGKLQMDIDLQNLPEFIEQSGFILLQLSTEAILLWSKLPMHHKDPFDRLLIGESIHSSARLVTPDKQIRRYPVNVLW